MARPTGEMRRYALIGAEQRLLQISAEAQAIYRAFPELRRRSRELTATVEGGLTRVPSAFGDRVSARKGRGPGRPRKRRTMSADARRRISEAQKARWAKQKAQSGGAKKK